MLITQDFERPDHIKIMINIGACLDIPTGDFIKGTKGQYVLIGGLGDITAIVGRANRYKSMILHYQSLSAADRLFSTFQTSIGTYDTENNKQEHALKRFLTRFDNLMKYDLFEEGIWNITNKTIYHGNKWYERVKQFIKHKKDISKELIVTLPFYDRDGVTPLRVIAPTFCEIDSFSEFETEDVAKIQDENELGDAGAQMIHMRQGLAKTRFFMEAPTLFASVNHFLGITAHLDDVVQVATSPYAPQPVKKLQHMKVNDKIKGVTNKFFYLMSNCWHAVSASLLINQNTKGPEYPKNANDNIAGDIDLNEVVLTQLRSKSGPTGYNITLVVSQSEGVLPSLTEFHYIKNFKTAQFERFGISGNAQNYWLDLLPDVKLSRTTIRSKIDNDPMLRRALNITSEMAQIYQFHKKYWDILCTPKELYEGLKEQGYDWNVLLNTRGWWTVNDDEHPIPFLSTLDLIMMYRGLYYPYWMVVKDQSNDKNIKTKE